VTVESIIQAIRPETVLISLMYVNNELGTIQPVVELGKRLRLINQERLHQGWPRIYFHVDAVQALNNLIVARSLEADLIAFSRHKISAPKGIAGFIFGIKRHCAGSLMAVIRTNVARWTLNVPESLACRRIHY
jgi:cysteine desulfurase